MIWLFNDDSDDDGRSAGFRPDLETQSPSLETQSPVAVAVVGGVDVSLILSC